MPPNNIKNLLSKEISIPPKKAINAEKIVT